MDPSPSPPPIFFVHVMKTAGTSVSQRLASLYEGWEQVFPPRGLHLHKVARRPLLELSAEQRRTIRLYSVHMPAWLADTVGPDFVRLSLLREPVARTTSHLAQLARVFGLTDLEALYDDPAWRGRLTDYQTRIFSLTRADYEANVQLWDTAVDQAVRVAMAGTDDERAAAEAAQDADQLGALNTGIAEIGDIGPDALSRAVATIDRFDVVGVTEDLEQFRRAVTARISIDLPPFPHGNKAPDPYTVSPALRSRIEADSQLDLELYAHVCRRLAG